MNLSRIRAAAGVLACALVAGTMLQVIAPAFALDPIATVLATPAASTSVDLTGLVSAAGSLIVSAVSVVAYFFLNKFVKDANARTVILGAVENGAKWGVAKIAGALPGSVLSVNVGSAVAAAGLQHVISTVPGALAQHGDDYAGVVRMILGKLPIDGAIDDGVVNQIVATATGKAVGGVAPAPAPNLASFVAQASPLIAQEITAILANRSKPAAAAA